MWHGGNGTSGANEDFRWSGWRLPPKYAPLLVGLCCGIAVVLLAISGAFVWRCVLVPNRKKDSCKNTYEEVIPRSTTNGSLPLSREIVVYALRSGCSSRLVGRSSALCRSATLGSMPAHNSTCEETFSNHESWRPASQSFDGGIETRGLLRDIVPAFIPEARHTNLTETERSKLSPALEDLHAKVNFSKKRKNRMRKDEAAIIAMSKSRSGHDHNSIALAGSAVVVYNERTAL